VPELFGSTTAGFKLPVILLLLVLGRVGTPSPAQMEELFPNEKVGVTIGFTVTVNVKLGAHGLLVL
jgi:hypothetical protein